MRNLLVGVRSGQDRQAYASAQARQAGLEHGARLRADELVADLASSAMALRTVARQLPGEAWQVPVRIGDSAPCPAAGLLTRRLVEVELHRCDLGARYGPAHWPAPLAPPAPAQPLRSRPQGRIPCPPPARPPPPRPPPP